MENKHLRYNNRTAYESGYKGHPQKEMEKLGITYQHATPQTLGDQWWFWNCKNLPKELPVFLEKTDWNPIKMIGFGLSEKRAIEIYNN